nr:transposase, MuDR [Tanacetum cinerariifolium]
PRWKNDPGRLSAAPDSLTVSFFFLEKCKKLESVTIMRRVITMRRVTIMRGVITMRGSNHNEGSDNNEGVTIMRDNIDSNVELVSSTKPEPQAKNNENLVYEEVDLEDFDSEIDSDEDEAERMKALRKLGKCHKPVDGNTYTENFYVSQTFPNKDLIKDMVTKISVWTMRELHLTRNDKERVREECRGIVPCFSNSGPNEDGLVDGPSG